MFSIARWNDKVHGKTSEAFYVWIEDPDSNYMYHSEFFLITKKQASMLSHIIIIYIYYYTMLYYGIIN